MNLYLNYFIPENGKRKIELNKALEANIANRFIKKIIILSNDPVPFKSDKIEEYPIKGMPTYKDFFDLFEEDQINVLSNLDISYNETIRHAERLENRTAYCITRHEIDAGGNLITFGAFHGKSAKPEWSQDTWIVRGKCKVDIPENATAQHTMTGQFKDIPFVMGVAGCDNLMAYYLKKKYVVKNPQTQIVCKHHHASQYRPQQVYRFTGATSRWGVITHVSDFNL